MSAQTPDPSQFTAGFFKALWSVTPLALPPVVYVLSAHARYDCLSGFLEFLQQEVEEISSGAGMHAHEQFRRAQALASLCCTKERDGEYGHTPTNIGKMRQHMPPGISMAQCLGAMCWPFPEDGRQVLSEEERQFCLRACSLMAVIEKMGNHAGEPHERTLTEFMSMAARRMNDAPFLQAMVQAWDERRQRHGSGLMEVPGFFWISRQAITFDNAQLLRLLLEQCSGNPDPIAQHSAKALIMGGRYEEENPDYQFLMRDAHSGSWDLCEGLRFAKDGPVDQDPYWRFADALVRFEGDGVLQSKALERVLDTLGKLMDITLHRLPEDAQVTHRQIHQFLDGALMDRLQRLMQPDHKAHPDLIESLRDMYSQGVAACQVDLLRRFEPHVLPLLKPALSQMDGCADGNPFASEHLTCGLAKTYQRTRSSANLVDFERTLNYLAGLGVRFERESYLLHAMADNKHPDSLGAMIRLIERGCDPMATNAAGKSLLQALAPQKAEQLGAYLASRKARDVARNILRELDASESGVAALSLGSP